MSRPLFDTDYIFGIHEPGGEQHMLEAGKPGWILFTEGIGSDPNDQSGRDYRPYSDQGLGVMVRLNNGYHPAGTIPNSAQYENFAARCANFAAQSPGCKIWIIGNEMNYEIERPPATASRAASPRGDQPSPPIEPDPKPEHDGWFGNITKAIRNLWQTVFGGADHEQADAPTDDAQLPAQDDNDAPVDIDDPRRRRGRFSALYPDVNARGATSRSSAGEAITPEKYARCYRLCRDAIHAQPGHAADQVLIGAVAPWNDQTRYAGNENGDWIKYFEDILTLLGPDDCDGFTIHTYTHGADANLIHSDAKMDPPFDRYHYHFKCYRDFMQVVPAYMRHLPAYITETDEDVPWKDANIGWVQAAYGEINWWNSQPGNQQIRSLILYRWPNIDRWVIEGKQGVIDDFRQALQNDYRWQEAFGAGDIVATTDVVNLRRIPGYVGQPADDVLAQLPAGTRLVILSDESQSVDELTWWSVEMEDATARGWLAQNAANGTVLLVKVEDGGEITPPPITDIFEIGDHVQTLTTVRMRQTPGYAGKPPSDVIADLPPGTELVVTDGPRAADELTWWRLTTTLEGADLDGWMADHDSNGQQLLEKIETAPPPPDGTFQPGDWAVTLDVVNMRKSPGYNGKPADDVIQGVPQGTSVQIVSGPERADDLIWWQVDVTGQQGWMAETAPSGTLLLSPASPPPEGTFTPGDQAKTLDVVNLRSSPGYVGKPATDVIAGIPADTRVTILGGPIFADDLTWWETECHVADGSRPRGWMAETAPNGAQLLAPLEDDGTPPVDDGSFIPGECAVAAIQVRVRRTPGVSGKPADDILGEFRPRTTLNIISGPIEADNMQWWQVGGITPRGEAVGWVAATIPGGVVLLSRAAQLPGTQIPHRSTGNYLHMPFQDTFGIAQLWGENPDFYSRYTYDEVPLLGHNGIDFLTPENVPVVAVEAGSVLQSGFEEGGFGNWLIVAHSWGQSFYAHLNSIDVQQGHTVQRGARLALSGNTGGSLGPHLHFAIRINPYDRADGWGGFSDPLPYFDPKNIEWPDYVLPSAAPRGVLSDMGRANKLAPSPMAVEVPGVARP